MKKDKYSKIQWEEFERNGFIDYVDIVDIIAKRTSKDYLKDDRIGELFKKCTLKDKMTIQLKNVVCEPWNDKNMMEIGTGRYDIKYILKIVEEIENRKILVNDESKVMDRLLNDSVTIKIRYAEEKDYPIVIEGNGVFYLLAPCIVGD